MNPELPPPEKPTGTRWLVFGLACAVSWLLYVHRYAWGVVKPELKADLDLTDAQLGRLDSLFTITYGIGQVPGGLAGDVLGARAVLPGLILSWSACLAGVALAVGPWVVGTFWASFGAAQAGTYPILNRVTRGWFPPSVRTTVQGLVASLSGRAGGACASLLVATLLMAGLGLSWRMSLLVLAALGVVVAAAFWLLYRNSPREHPWVNAREAELIEAGGPPSVVGARPRLVLGGRRTWTLAALLLYAFASTFADQLFVFWIPLFLREGKGLSTAEMGVFASLPLLGGALGGAVGGVLNDVLIRATGNRRLARSVIALAGKVLAGVLIALSVLVEDGRWVMVVLFACKFFNDWGLSTLWGTITDIAGRASGTVFGVVNTSGAVAAFVAGHVMGQIKQSYGWDALFFTVAVVFTAAGLCWLVIDCTQRLVEEEGS